MTAIAPGCRVVMHYRLASAEGLMVDTTERDEPLGFVVGDGTLHPQLEQSILGVAANEQVRFLLGPDEAFGRRDEQNVHAMARSEFPPGSTLVPGHVFGFTTPSGLELPGRIVDADEESVTIDFNHPLAGQSIVFEVEVLQVECPE